MRELLQRWAAIEPGRCKYESEFNQIQPREREQLAILTPYGWQIVFTEAGCHPDEYRMTMAIQVVVQAAIVSRGWYINLFYHYEEWRAETGPKVPSDSFCKASNPAEALLSAYLKALEVSK